MIKCNNCKHKWIPRSVNKKTGIPYACPKCKNPRKMEVIKQDGK